MKRLMRLTNSGFCNAARVTRFWWRLQPNSTDSSRESDWRKDLSNRAVGPMPEHSVTPGWMRCAPRVTSRPRAGNSQSAPI